MAEMKKTRSKTSATASVGEGATKKSKTPAMTTRHEMISVAAYLRAERRGFSGGNPEDDWYAAEAEIEAMLANGAKASSSRRD